MTFKFSYLHLQSQCTSLDRLILHYFDKINHIKCMSEIVIILHESSDYLPAPANSKMAPCILATPLSGAHLKLNCPMTVIQYKCYCYAHNADNQRVTFCLWPIWVPHHCHTQIERKPENFHFHGLMQRAVSGMEKTSTIDVFPRVVA